MEMTVNYDVIYRDTLCCEPILRRMPWGFLLVCECGGTCEPAVENKMYSFTSADGLSWNGPYEIWPEEEGAQCLSELLVTPDGWALGFFIRHSGGFTDTQTVLRRSRDGVNWENVDFPAELASMHIYRGSVELPDGSGCIIPYQFHKLHGPAPEGARLWDKGVVQQVENGVLQFMWDGSMHKSSNPAATEFPTQWGRNFIWTESTIVLTEKDGLKMLMRMDGTGVLYASESNDLGVTWSAPLPTTIPNPGNKIRLYMLPDDRIVLLHTPNTVERAPFSLWISEDGLRSFTQKIDLLAEEGSLYHYADCIWHDGMLWLTIERNRKEILVFRCKL